MNSSAVIVQNVSHRYKRLAAVEGARLTIPAAKLTGFIGADGAGKSTLLGLIAGAKRIQSGHVTVLGANMADSRQRRAVCARIAYMPQGLGRNLYPELTVAENLAFFGRLFGLPKKERAQRIHDLLRDTGLAPFPDRAASHLSGGMRQKLGLCCALIHDPDVLILDEPTTGVDPLSRRQFWRLIGSMRASRPNMTVLVATAYMEEAERFDHLFAMDGGRVLATGSPAAIKQHTGCDTLEESFIHLLPEIARRSYHTLQIPPYIPASAEPVIVARNLTRRFGQFVAVNDVSFTIKRGEIFGFVGSNGCGKTTTMKMLTGLLPPTSGHALLFGQCMEVHDATLRYHVGYMSQSFSLYTEMTVQQNLDLHARLYHLPAEKAALRISYLIEHFRLGEYVGTQAASLPLGIRQRLSLAVAVVHEPPLLILDEPTSGVDPIARDQFWELLVELSRQHGVTIFVSTHFMNEADRCDRIALMHAGHVLTIGPPAKLARGSGTATLEDAFIIALERAAGPEEAAPLAFRSPLTTGRASPARRFDPGRLLAYTWRESLELLRDKVRLGFALLGTVFLMLVFGFGINTDVDRLSFAVLDRDQTPESREYVHAFSGSSYFQQKAPIASAGELNARLADGSLKVAIEIPPRFGRDLRAGRSPEVGAWIDGAMPFQAETTEGYVAGVHQTFLDEVNRLRGIGQASTTPEVIETRFRYNQDFKSVNAMVPGTLAMLLALIPAILMAVAVVREKELGSITNLYVTPVTRFEFILGKQLPFIGVALANFLCLWLIAVSVFGVPMKGSFATLAVGTLLYVASTTGFGLFVSSFASTQLAAQFGTAILTVLPATQFSGMLVPVSSLEGVPALIANLFPMTFYLPISVGTFTKALGFAELWPTMLALAVFAPALILLSVLLLRKQAK